MYQCELESHLGTWIVLIESMVDVNALIDRVVEQAHNSLTYGKCQPVLVAGARLILIKLLRVQEILEVLVEKAATIGY